ncbi:MAG: YciI family protein [Hyphomicrobiales bacterium]
MPSWNEYRETAKSRGALAFELFVVETVLATTPQDMQATLPAHLAYQKEQEAAGKLFLAGPMSDVSGENMSGGGLIVYRAASMDEARSLAESDPMHAEGKRTFTLRKWIVNEGSPSFSMALSDQRVVVS